MLVARHTTSNLQLSTQKTSLETNDTISWFGNSLNWESMMPNSKNNPICSQNFWSNKGGIDKNMFHHHRSPVVVLEANACELAIELDSAWQNAMEVLYRRHVLLPISFEEDMETWRHGEQTDLEGFHFRGVAGREFPFKKSPFQAPVFQENKQIVLLHEVAGSVITGNVFFVKLGFALHVDSQSFATISFHILSYPTSPKIPRSSTISLHRSNMFQKPILVMLSVRILSPWCFFQKTHHLN